MSPADDEYKVLLSLLLVALVVKFIDPIALAGRRLIAHFRPLTVFNKLGLSKLRPVVSIKACILHAAAPSDGPASRIIRLRLACTRRL